VKKKKTLFLLGMACFAVVLTAFLPKILSSDMALNFVLGQLQQRYGVQLRIENFAIGWRQGFVCSAVDYEDVERGLELRIEQIRGSQGLLALLVAANNLGTIRLQHPVLMLARQKPQREKRTEQVVVDQAKAPFWEDVLLSLAFDNGRLLLRQGPSVAAAPAGVFSGTASLSSGTIHYALQWLSDEEKGKKEEKSKNGKRGKVGVQGFVNLPARNFQVLDTLVARIQLQLSSFQIAPWLSLIVPETTLPQGRGVLDGELTIQGTGRENLDVVGKLQGKDLHLTGGILGSDQPWLEKISFVVDGRVREGEGLQLTKFSLKSDLGSLAASGSYGPYDGALNGAGSLRLPVLLARFPHLFSFSKPLALTEGTMAISAKLSREGEQHRLTLEGTSDPLSFVLTVGTKTAAAGEQEKSYNGVLRLDLSRLAELSRDLQQRAGERSMAGKLHFSAAGFLAKDQLVFRDFDLRAKDLKLDLDGRRIEVDDLVVQPRRLLTEDAAPVALRSLLVTRDKKTLREQGYGLTTYGWKQQRLVLRDMKIRSSIGEKDIDVLRLVNVQGLEDVFDSLSKGGK